MTIGSMRHLVTIQQPTRPNRSASGERAVVWKTFAKIHAAIEPQTGRQLEYAKSFSSAVTHKITARYRAGILPTFRLLYGSRVFMIKASICIDERRRELNLFCEEIVAT